jgi:hypothetical protein
LSRLEWRWRRSSTRPPGNDRNRRTTATSPAPPVRGLRKPYEPARQAAAGPRPACRPDPALPQLQQCRVGAVLNRPFPPVRRRARICRSGSLLPTECSLPRCAGSRRAVTTRSSHAAAFTEWPREGAVPASARRSPARKSFGLRLVRWIPRHRTRRPISRLCRLPRPVDRPATPCIPKSYLIISQSKV